MSLLKSKRRAYNRADKLTDQLFCTVYSLHVIQDVDGIKSTDVADTFSFLKAHYNQEQ